MPNLTSNTYAYLLFKTNVSGVRAFKWAFEYGIFEALILGMAGLSFLILYILKRCCKGWFGIKGEENKDEAMIELTKREVKKLKTKK